MDDGGEDPLAAHEGGRAAVHASDWGVEAGERRGRGLRLCVRGFSSPCPSLHRPTQWPVFSRPRHYKYQGIAAVLSGE